MSTLSRKLTQHSIDLMTFMQGEKWGRHKCMAVLALTLVAMWDGDPDQESEFMSFLGAAKVSHERCKNE